MYTFKFYPFILSLVSVGFVTCSNSSSLSDNTVNPSGNDSLSSEDPDNQSAHASFTGLSASAEIITKIPLPPPPPSFKPPVKPLPPVRPPVKPPPPVRPPVKPPPPVRPGSPPSPDTVIRDPFPFDKTPEEDNPNPVKRPTQEPTTDNEIEEVEQSQIVDKPPKNYEKKRSGTCKEGPTRKFACIIFIMSTGSILVVPAEAGSEAGSPSSTADEEKDKEVDKGVDQTQTADEVVDQSQIVDITPKGYTKERAGTCKGPNGIFKCTIYTMPTGPTLVTALKSEKLPSGAAKVEVFSMLLLVLNVALTVEM